MTLCGQISANWTELEFEETKVQVYLPENTESNKEYSLMVNLHGCAQGGNILKNHGNWGESADKHQAIIAIPNVPNGGVYAGCWDYYGLNHGRDKGHVKFILGLVDKLKATYKIKKNHTFLSGLSSGAGLSQVLACTAPDVFSGMAIVAGPSVGTQALEINRATISLQGIIQNCQELAGKGATAKHLESLAVVVAYGDNDYIVDTDYNKLNAQAFAQMMKATQTKEITLNDFKGAHLVGKATQFIKANHPVVTLIENEGLGHNWPAGDGKGRQGFVNGKSLNFPDTALSLLTTYNQRP